MNLLLLLGSLIVGGGSARASAPVLGSAAINLERDCLEHLLEHQRGPVADDTDARLCDALVLNGHLRVCGDLKLTRGRASVLSSVNVTSLLPEGQRRHCVIPTNHIFRVLDLDDVDLIVSGRVEVGGSMVADAIQVDVGGSLHVGLLGLGGRFWRAPRGIVGLADERMSTAVDQTMDIHAIRDSFECPPLKPDGTADLQISNVGFSEATEWQAIGDIFARLDVTADNGASLWSFGNIRGSSLIVDDGSNMESLCGQIYTNPLPPGLGLIVGDGGAIRAGGRKESGTRAVTMKDGGHAQFQGALTVADFVQVDDGATLVVEGALTATGVAIDDGSIMDVRGNMLILDMLEVIDSGHLQAHRNLEVRTLKLFDGASAVCGGNVDVRGYVILDNRARLTVDGTAMDVSGLLHVSNSSEFERNNGGIRVGASTRCITSSCKVEGNLETNHGLYIAQGADAVIRGDIIVNGVEVGQEAFHFESPGPSQPPIPSMAKAQDAPTATDPPTHPPAPTAAVPTAPGMGRLDVDSAATTSTQPPRVDSTSSPQPPRVDSTSSPANRTFVPPALFVDGSQLHATGAVDLPHGWMQILRSSRVMIGQTLRIVDGFLSITGRSLLEISGSSADIGIGVGVTKGSEFVLTRGSLATGYLEVDKRSRVRIFGTAAMRNSVTIAGASRWTTGGSVRVGAPSLTIDERSIVELRGLSADGDVFVDDSAILRALIGNVTAGGSIIAQDEGMIVAADKLDAAVAIIAENGGSVQGLGGIAAGGDIRVACDSFLTSMDESKGYRQVPTFELIKRLRPQHGKARADIRVAGGKSDEERKSANFQRWDPDDKWAAVSFPGAIELSSR